MKTQRYAVNQVDGTTFQLVDQFEQREICVCSDYDDWEDAKERATAIAYLLNDQNAVKALPAWVAALGRAFGTT